MRDELCHRPVRGFGEVASADAVRGLASAAHRLGLQPHRELDVEGALLAVGGAVEVRQRLRISSGPHEGPAKRRQRLHRHDPRRDRAGEVLRQKGSQRLVFPGLYVERAPVVEQGQAEDVVLRLGHRHRLTQRVGPADQDAQLEQSRRLVRPALELALRAREGVAAGQDRGCPAVVADRQPLVVRQQRSVGAEEPAHRGGVMDADVEVGVVADLARQAQLHLRHRQQRFAPALLLRTAAGQAGAERLAQLAPRFGPQAHQAIHLGVVDQADLAQVEHLVSDGHADAPVHIVGLAKASERQVLDREIGCGIVGRLQPARKRRVVGRVDARVAHGFLGSKCFLSPCQQR